jgi:polyvinyl alcohol dehydrogenase (cytochrome)
MSAVRRITLAALAILAAVAAGPVATASAAADSTYAAGFTFVPPTVVVTQGDTLRFNNMDIAAHSLTSSTPGLFDSGTISGGSTGLVTGVDKLPPGNYQFFCSIHFWMHGVLQVVAPTSIPQPPPPPPTPDPNNPPNAFDAYPHATPAALTTGDWPFYGHDLANTRDGGSDGPSLTQAPFLEPVWDFESTNGDFVGTPLESGGTVIGLSGGGSVYALDASTGKLLWQRDLGQPADSTPAIADGMVFVPLVTVSSPSIVALSLATGATVWSTVVDTQNGSTVFGSPVVWNGTVYMGISGQNGDPALASLRGAVVAVNEFTGARDWESFMVPSGFNGAAVWSTPAIDTATGHLFVGTGNAYVAPAAGTTDSMVELDATTGAMLNSWQETAGDVFSPNSLSGQDFDFGSSANLITTSTGQQLVGQGSKSGTYWALDRSSMTPVWHQNVGPGSAVGGIIGSTAYDGKQVYGPITPAGEQWALSADSGSVAWASSDGDELHWSPTSVANGVVYTPGQDGVLTLRDAATGATVGKVPLPGMTYGGVAIAGGYVFAAVGTQSSSGYIAAYRADPPTVPYH